MLTQCMLSLGVVKSLTFYKWRFVLPYERPNIHNGVIIMKRTIANTNSYFSTSIKKEKMIVNSVYTSSKVEGSKTTKKELKEHYKLIHS